MAKGVNQKLKIIYLMKILLEKTDEEHSITMQEIKESLEAYGIGRNGKACTAISKACVNMAWTLLAGRWIGHIIIRWGTASLNWRS